MKISKVSEMRRMDKAAVEQFGIPEEILMENAGHAAYNLLSEKVGIKGKRFLVFCGIGNNGGDGFVVARKIHSNGGDVKVFILGDPNKFKGAAKLNLDIISRFPIDIERIEFAESVKTEIWHCNAIIDAIFGTGLARNVEGLYRDVIELINNSKKTVLSLDIPSGVHGDTGQVMGTSVKADYTVTFGLPKLGNILFPGYALGGELSVTHISFPPSLYTDDSLKIAVNYPPELPGRNQIAHKGDFGEALFIAGASCYFGAPYFAAILIFESRGRLFTACSA